LVIDGNLYRIRRILADGGIVIVSPMKSFEPKSFNDALLSFSGKLEPPDLSVFLKEELPPATKKWKNIAPPPLNERFFRMKVIQLARRPRFPQKAGVR
jgi:hypothetical protein